MVPAPDSFGVTEIESSGVGMEQDGAEGGTSGGLTVMTPAQPLGFEVPISSARR